MAKVFLSYSSKDSEFVDRLVADLYENDVKVWIDNDAIKVGDSIIEKINEGIGKNDFLGIVLSPNSMASGWVMKELNAALVKEVNERFVFVLPILMKNCEIPLIIADKKYADFRKQYSTGLNQLLDVVKSVKSSKVPDKKEKGKTEKSGQELFKIYNNPFIGINDQEAVFQELLKVNALPELKKIAESPFVSNHRKIAALTHISNHPQGFEDYLNSIVTGPFSNKKEQEIALEGLIKAKATNHLNRIKRGAFTPNWILDKIT